MILPTQAALERVPSSLIEASADLGGEPAADLPVGDPAARPPRRRRRLDLHLLAHPRRLHHAADRRHLDACSSARRSTRPRAPPGTSRSPPPSRWCRSSSWRSTSPSPAGSGPSMRCEASAAPVPPAPPPRSEGTRSGMTRWRRERRVVVGGGSPRRGVRGYPLHRASRGPLPRFAGEDQRAFRVRGGTPMPRRAPLGLSLAAAGGHPLPPRAAGADHPLCLHHGGEELPVPAARADDSNGSASPGSARTSGRR